MRKNRAFALVATTTIAFAACSGSGAPTAAPQATPLVIAPLIATAVPATTPPNESPEASVGSVDGGQASASPLDPCDLITVDEASTLIGAKLGAGVSSMVDQDRVCTFKKGLTEVKLFLLPRAATTEEAKAYWTAARGEIPAEFPVKDVTLFVGAIFGSGSAGGVSLSALIVLDGVQAFDLYCGFPRCGETASVAEAQRIGDRLP